MYERRITLFTCRIRKYQLRTISVLKSVNELIKLKNDNKIHIYCLQIYVNEVKPGSTLSVNVVLYHLTRARSRCLKRQILINIIDKKIDNFRNSILE